MVQDSIYNYTNSAPFGSYNYPSPFSQQSTMNDDFMKNISSSEQMALQQALLQNANLQGPQADTFQSSQSGLGTGLTLGVLGGGAAFGGKYFFGTNPIKDGKVAPELIEAYGKVKSNEWSNTVYKQLYEKSLSKELAKHGLNTAQYNAIEQLARSEKLDDLAKAAKDALPADIQTVEAAKEKIKNIKPEVDKIDTAKIKDIATKRTNAFNLDYQTRQLKNLQSAQAKILTLGENATKAEIEKFLINNAETFKLKGTPAQIEKNAAALANKFDTRAALENMYKARINAKTDVVNDLRKGFELNIKSHWNETTKAFAENAPKELNQAVKNFKVKSAGKWGLIAGGIALVTGWLFGGNKA